MNCREVLAKLYDYLDKELVANESQEVERHIEVCSDCLKKYQLEEGFNRIVKEKTPKAVDVAALKKRVKQEIDKIDAASHPRNIFFLLGPLVAAAIIVTLIIIPLSKGSNPQSVLGAVRPFADEHTNCMKKLTQYAVKSSDPEEVKHVMEKLANLPDDLFDAKSSDVHIEGGAMAHLSIGEDPHLDFSAWGEDVSVFVVESGSIDKSPFQKIDHGGESFYIGSCPLYQYIIWSCEGHECVAVSKLPQQKLVEFASIF